MEQCQKIPVRVTAPAYKSNTENILFALEVTKL